MQRRELTKLCNNPHLAKPGVQVNCLFLHLMIKNLLGFFVLSFLVYMISITTSGCAQISSPTGGPKDTIAPVLERAEPANYTTNFTGNKIVLTFDEYINVENISENVLVSPLQKSNPIISFNFRTVTIKLRDTLIPNTTYSINFGQALKDLNENNPFENFTYIFSTGSIIDSFSLNGRVLLAESGKTDSTLIATLYRDLSDTAVSKKRPLYIAKVRSDGSFGFKNLPGGNFRLYALRDGDGGKTYNSKSEAFAFQDSGISIGAENAEVTLYAYEEVKKVTTTTTTSSLAEKRLRFTTNLSGKTQDITKPLEIVFNNAIKQIDEKRITLLDTNALPVTSTTLTLDSSRKKLRITTPWIYDYDYSLVIPKDAVVDSAGNNLFKTDTLLFTTNRAENFGNVLLRFKNLTLSNSPVLQLFIGEEIKYSFPIVGDEWSGKMIQPGEYEMRILYDTNKNGRWDPGSFEKKIQPERAISLGQKLAVRANWDNELDVNL